MGNMTPVLYNFDNSRLEYLSQDTDELWIAVPYFTDLSTSGGEATPSEVPFSDGTKPGQVPGTPSARSMAISLGSLPPAHRAVTELNAYESAKTVIRCRFRTSPENEVFSSGPTGNQLQAAIATTGIVTLTLVNTGSLDDKDFPSLSLLGRGHAVKIGTARYPIYQFGTEPLVDGTTGIRTGTTPNWVSEIYVWPKPAAAVTVDAASIVKPRLEREFFATVSGMGNFAGGPGAQLTSGLTLNPTSDFGPWIVLPKP